MPNYYVNLNQQPDSGVHEIHKENCDYLPDIENRKYLGIFKNCHKAVNKAVSCYSIPI